MSREIAFTKMVGAGNDFVIVDARRGRHPLAGVWPKVARAVCDRHRGIGADGVLVLEPSRKADVRMRIFNADGSEAEMCGNGARCVAWYAANASRARAASAKGRTAARGSTSRRAEVTIETQAGLLSAVVSGERVEMVLSEPHDLRLDGQLAIDGRTIRYGFVNTGVPHAIVPVERLDDVEVDRLGRAIRRHEAFQPKGTNVNFVQAVSPSKVRVRTYERGVEAETLACGTGVAASAVIHAAEQVRAGNGHATEPGAPRSGVARKRSTMPIVRPARESSHAIDVETRSGDILNVRLAVSCTGQGYRAARVVLTGPARRVCAGTFSWPMGSA